MVKGGGGYVCKRSMRGSRGCRNGVVEDIKYRV